MQKLHRVFLVTVLLLLGTNLQAQPPFELPVFTQPYEKCRMDPLTNELVCTKVFVGGCTIEGKSFAEYGSCSDVRTQRPFYPKRPYKTTDPNDKRLEDPSFISEYNWLTSQVQSCGCVCCHDSTLDPANPQTAGWDIAYELGPLGRPSSIWTDHLTDRGVAIFAGALPLVQENKSYPPSENNGFAMGHSVMPSTDLERMKAYFKGELERRGVTQEKLDRMPPSSFFGGRMLERVIKQPSTPCGENVGVDKDGRVLWQGKARYVYIQKPGTANPTAPPILDTPEGTLWRMDRDHRLLPIEEGVFYGKPTAGMLQKFPKDSLAPMELVEGEEYKLYVTKDVLQPIENCLFTYPI